MLSKLNYLGQKITFTGGREKKTASDNLNDLITYSLENKIINANWENGSISNYEYWLFTNEEQSIFCFLSILKFCMIIIWI